MEIENANQGGLSVVCPRGVLAGPEAESLRARLAELAGNGKTEVVVDCSKVRFVDSRGLEVLMEAAEQFIRAGQTLKLTGVKPALLEVLELTEMSTFFEFQGDLSEPQPLEARA
jgi:stage II sporulation protein AA (anti-sigma F factor antagonist)